jgi:hypothetical protein
LRLLQQEVDEARKSGWLHKKGDTFKSFKKRFFQLDFSSSNSTAASLNGGPAHPRIGVRACVVTAAAAKLLSSIFVN